MSVIDEKWEEIFKQMKVAEYLERDGLFYIKADDIRKYKEPRLMTKFDTRQSLPEVFGGRWGILPVSRGTYVIGDFALYEEFPEAGAGITAVDSSRIPDYLETIDLTDIRSEAAAINVLGVSGILEDFLEEEQLFQTVSGRMKSEKFSFRVRGKSHGQCSELTVDNSQVEIDGGFEGRESFAILEGKNVVHSDFLVRQLYYPYRLWERRLKKPVRPVFMVYSNHIFRLLEYEFADKLCYNSIRLLRERNYSLEETNLSLEDLAGVWRAAKVKPEPPVTFIQADSFEKVISLTEHLLEGPLTAGTIAQLFGFRRRQSDYYYNACKYLGLAEKREDNGEKKVFLTETGRRILGLSYKRGQLEYVRLILEHRIFHDLFGIYLSTGQMPDRRFVAGRIRELGLCSEKLVDRRSSSVAGWLRYMAGLGGAR